MTGETLRTANLLGAAVLGLHDELKWTVERRSGHAGEASAALVALGHQPGLSNDSLTRLLGLTHTGTVRLIDRLIADGLVDRRSAQRDKRGVALYLTATGDSARRNILQDRAAALAPLVSGLSAPEQKALAALLGKLLMAISRDDMHKLRICRLCDSAVCKDCPILVPVAGQSSGAGPA